MAKGSDKYLPAVRDPQSEGPIPTAWRPVLKNIVGAFVTKDYQLRSGVSGVAPVSTETADQIRQYIQSYGAELTELPEETWNTSVCIWTGSRWDALIDLWTLSEGRSDLVLSMKVSAEQDSYLFQVYMVYVP